MYIAPQAELDDGELDVVLVSEVSKTTALRDLPKTFKGTHANLPYVQTLRGKKVELSADRPFTIYADGDPIGELPATVSVSARSLNVMVPKPSSKGQTPT
jgi:diacylglycerol kinase family enzyme